MKALSVLPFIAILLLSPLVQAVYWFPYDFYVLDGNTEYFGDEWFSTSGTYALITSWWEDSWLNYSTGGSGTQQIYNGSKPLTVYIDGIHQPETNGWTYSSSTVTVTTATYSVAMYWGTTVDVDDVDDGGGGGGGGSGLNVTFIATGNLKPAQNVKISVHEAVYGDYVGTIWTNKQGSASMDLKAGRYNYTAEWQGRKLSGTIFHVESQVIHLSFDVLSAFPPFNLNVNLRIIVVLAVVAVAAVAVFMVLGKRRR